MELAHPYYLIIGGLGLIFWLMRKNFWFKKTQISVPVEEGGQKIFRFKKWLVLIIGMVAWGYISFSITLPREPLSYTPNQVEVNDIFFVIDVSRSMLANDFKPDRLTVAKEKIREFVKLRPKDRIGIIMFSEKAFTLLPLSTDLELIQKIIDDIKVGFLGSGTNIGDALALAVARGAQSPTENKVIVLLTDGVSNVGVMTPSQAAVKAKDQDIKVYTIGIGGARDAKIPLGRGLLGGKRFQNIPGGSIDMQTLDEIANLTGGKSYYARDEKALTDVLDEIERLERTEINLSSKIIYKEHYFKYLLIGVLLLVLCELLSMYLLRLVI